ncbi:hypothetical protein LTR94_028844, partial [Friedmanniomyces endolithicus]
TLAGGQDYLEPLRASGLVAYTRGVAATAEDLARPIAELDPMRVPARGFSSASTARDLIAFAEEAAASGGMAVFLFHGIGADHLAVSAQDHAALLDWLSANRQDIWTTTLSEALAVRRVQASD